MTETAADCISLKQYRKRVLKVNQSTISERCGLSIPRISEFERGSATPPEEHVRALATAYGLTIDEFWRLFNRQPLGGGSNASGNESKATTSVAGAMSNAGGVAQPKAENESARGCAGGRQEAVANQ
ncbi:MAG TPA: helix-turn-helix transcriptional regulator [Planctomycetota bacterium]|nr:helix-turn-helix transcriptional regulator [Planctomycetota bacterium]